MSLYKIDSTLNSLRESVFDFPVTTGQTVYLYIQKKHRGGNVTWDIQDSFSKPIHIGEDIPDIDKYTQVIIEGVVDTEASRFHFCDLVEYSVFDKSDVVTPRAELQNYLVELWSLCFPDRKIPGLGRTPVPSDFKITTVWGSDKAGHMGRCDVTSEANFKLGVNWEVWHRRGSEARVRFLTHELTHLLQNHHKKSFFIDHATGVNTITASEEAQYLIESWFGEIDWNRVRAEVLRGPRQQPSELDIQAYQSRHEAVQTVISEMESVLGYSYDAGRRLYINPPISEVKRGFTGDLEQHEFRSVDDLLCDLQVTDTELNTYITEVLEADTYGFEYDTADLPIVSPDGVVIENKLYVALFQKMSQSVQANHSEAVSIDAARIPCIVTGSP